MQYNCKNCIDYKHRTSYKLHRKKEPALAGSGAYDQLTRMTRNPYSPHVVPQLLVREHVVVLRVPVRGDRPITELLLEGVVQLRIQCIQPLLQDGPCGDRVHIHSSNNTKHKSPRQRASAALFRGIQDNACIFLELGALLYIQALLLVRQTSHHSEIW